MLHVYYTHNGATRRVDGSPAAVASHFAELAGSGITRNAPAQPQAAAVAEEPYTMPVMNFDHVTWGPRMPLTSDSEERAVPPRRPANYLGQGPAANAEQPYTMPEMTF